MAIDQNFINNLRSMLENSGNPLRGNFYMEIARAYSAAGSTDALMAAHQVVIQAQITTYSGQYGAAALLGNLNAKNTQPQQYLLTLDGFSSAIATRMLDAIEVE